MAKVGALASPVGLFIFAFTSYGNVHWIAPIIGSIPFGFGVQYVYTAVFSYTADNWRPVAASAMGANSVSRSAFAAAFPLFAEQMAYGLGTAGAGALLAGINVLIVSRMGTLQRRVHITFLAIAKLTPPALPSLSSASTYEDTSALRLRKVRPTTESQEPLRPVLVSTRPRLSHPTTLAYTVLLQLFALRPCELYSNTPHYAFIHSLPSCHFSHRLKTPARAACRFPSIHFT